MLSSKVWQFTIWDYVRMVFASYFQVAFVAKNNAIIAFFRTTFSKRYTRNNIRLHCHDRFVAFSTSWPQPIIIFILSILGYKSRIDMEAHNNLPPSYTWRKEPMNHTYWCYCGDRFTGMVIWEISRLRLPPFIPEVHKYLTLSRPHYCIKFWFKCADGNTHLEELAEFLSLEEAQNIAELYYHEWEEVNQDIAEPNI